MRRYGIGAFLLEINGPGRAIVRLREPLLQPGAQKPNGDLPGGHLILPCHATAFANVPLPAELTVME